jgi:hypothetical protein
MPHLLVDIFQSTYIIPENLNLHGYTKNNNHQLMHKKYYLHYKNLVHVSTLLGHLQGEQFRYTGVALIHLSEHVPLTSHSIERERELSADRV